MPFFITGQVDQGSEFFAGFSAFCKSKGITVYSSGTTVKAARVEALNYEIKLIMNRAMTQYNSKDAAKFLPLALDVHNSSESSGLPSGMTPNDAD